MSRVLYLCMIWLHPRVFRQRFAEEMLWIFDEKVERGGVLPLFADAVGSLFRQWLLRSNIWKMGAGAVVSCFLLFGWWHSQESALNEALQRGNPGQLEEARRKYLVEHETLLDGVFGGVAQAAARQTSDGWPIRPVEISPRIAALKKRVEAGDHHGVDEFRQEATRASTPLIEPAQDSTHYVIVTFVWLGDAGTRSVGLLAPLLQRPGLPNLPLNRLLDTDLWFGSWEMRDDLRFTYRFLPNVKPGDKYLQQDAKVDPLNSHNIKVSYDEGATTTEFSITAMPHALDESWIIKQPNVPAGRVEGFEFKSAILNTKREISVYTPPGYNEKEQSGYWLLVLFDGFFYRNSIPTPTILDNLIHAGKIPPIVAVMIDNPGKSRVSELGYNPAFEDFLSKEMQPWIHEHWNVTRDPRKSIVGGLSMGGSAAAFVAMRRPDLFGNVLSQSGAFADGNGKDVKWEWLASQYEASPKLSIRFFIEEGLLEDVSRDGPTGVAANRHLAQILKTKGYVVNYEEVGGSHEPVHWRGALAEGLISLTK
jgi:enterochelin esterase family protein